MNDLIVTTEIWDSGMDDSPGCWVEVRFRLAPDDIKPPSAAVTVRVFCTRDDLTIDQLKAEGRRIAASHLSRIVELVGAPEIGEELWQRWR